MIVAQSKRKSNIVEYILYMYQIEDIIRSLNFDIGLIDQMIVQNYEQPSDVKVEIKNWYKRLADQMVVEDIKQKGHLREHLDLVNELSNVHKEVMNTVQDKLYIKAYEKARPFLKELVLKSGGEQMASEIEVGIHGLYGLLVLRLKKQEVNDETELAFKTVSGFLAQLAVYFHKKERGELLLKKEQHN